MNKPWKINTILLVSLRSTASYLQVCSATWKTSLSQKPVDLRLLALRTKPSEVWLPLPFTGYSEIVMISNIIFTSLCHCVFRYLDAVDSYTQISLLHRTRDCWYFQGVPIVPPNFRWPNLDSATLLTLAFYFSHLSTAAFTCSNLSTVSLLSSHWSSLFRSRSECGPLSTSILVSLCRALSDYFSACKSLTVFTELPKFCIYFSRFILFSFCIYIISQNSKNFKFYFIVILIFVVAEVRFALTTFCLWGRRATTATTPRCGVYLLRLSFYYSEF